MALRQIRHRTLDRGYFHAVLRGADFPQLLSKLLSSFPCLDHSVANVRKLFSNIGSKAIDAAVLLAIHRRRERTGRTLNIWRAAAHSFVRDLFGDLVCCAERQAGPE